MKLQGQIRSTNHSHILLRVPKSPQLNENELLERHAGLYGPNGTPALVAWQAMTERGKIDEDIRRKLLERMGDVSVFTKELKHRFSRWYNCHQDRFGALWVERLKSVIVVDQPTSLEAVAAYIDLNPVREKGQPINWFRSRQWLERALEFLCRAGVSVRPFGFIHRCKVALAPLEVPKPTRWVISFSDRVVSLLNRVAMARLSGSLLRRRAKSCSVHPKRRNSSRMIRSPPGLGTLVAQLARVVLAQLALHSC